MLKVLCFDKHAPYSPNQLINALVPVFNCGLMTSYGDIQLGQNNGLGSGSVRSGYLNQCWLIIIEVLCHSAEGNFTGNTQDVYPWHEFENY